MYSSEFCFKFLSGTYCGQYQEMALRECKKTSIHELPPDEALDFNVLENSYGCKIPFEIDEFEDSYCEELKIEEIEPEEKPTQSILSNDMMTSPLVFNSPSPVMPQAIPSFSTNGHQDREGM